MQKRISYAVDIGGTKIQIALVCEDGTILKKIEIPSLAHEGGVSITKRIAEMIAKMHHPEAVGIGIGTAGQIDNSGKIQSATDVFKDWVGFPLADHLKKETGLNVKVINDVQAMALGEMHFGFAYKNMIALAMGTGVGGAIIQNGQLLRGETGAAGELGHLILKPQGRACPCGQFGCVEAYLSGPALEREFKHLSKKTLSAKDIFLSKDPLAQSLIQNYLENMIQTLTSLSNIFAPEAIILSGGVANSLGDWIPYLEENVRKRVLKINQNVMIKKSELLADAMLLGAASQFFI